MCYDHMRRFVEGNAILCIRLACGDEALCEQVKHLSDKRRQQLADEHPHQMEGIIESCQDANCDRKD